MFTSVCDVQAEAAAARQAEAAAAKQAAGDAARQPAGGPAAGSAGHQPATPKSPTAAPPAGALEVWKYRVPLQASSPGRA